VKSKDGIRNYYELRKVDNNKLEWTADFVDAASSGDLGYTYGHYTYTKTDSTGKPSVYKGIFHSVWKKQKDGKWKFVWD
jgi:ketosteroid isomerase-like protein